MTSSFSKLFVVALAFAASLSAQKPAAPQQQSQGIQPQWDISVILKEFAANANRLLPVLEQINPQTWVSKGAPEGYVTQLNTAKIQTKALATDSLNLAQDPERLSFALKVYFRTQSLQSMFDSLSDGIRRYQNPALADLLNGMVAEEGANRMRFQEYIVELAAEREQQFKVMDHEAQRCRGFLATQPPARKRTGGK